jgi:hypothetical protein
LETAGKEIFGEPWDFGQCLFGTTGGKVDLELGVDRWMKLGDLGIIFTGFLELRIDFCCFANCCLQETTRFLTIPDITCRGSTP